MVTERACPSCGRSWGLGRSCQWCGQVEGLPSGVKLSSPGKRFGAYLLEFGLAVVTLGLGWLAWALIVFKNGQTPAKQLLGMKAVTISTTEPAGWGRMFVREIVAKTLISTFIGWLILPYFWLLWDKDRQELWDKLVGTVVVDDPNKQLEKRGLTERLS